MSNYVLAVLLVIPIFSYAKPCGNGYIADWKTCHKGTSSRSSSSYSGSGSSSSYESDNNYSYSTQNKSEVQEGLYGNQGTRGGVLHSGITLRKSELRTCASKHCTVIKYLPKGEKISWSMSGNGFINIYNTVYWVKEVDVKK